MTLFDSYIQAHLKTFNQKTKREKKMKRAIKTIWNAVTLAIDPVTYIRNMSPEKRKEYGIKID